MDFETHDRRVIEELERQVADLQSRLDAQIAGHRKTAKDATDNLIRANEAERALAERAGGVKVRELLDKGLEILNGIIDNVKRRGNYSPESTCVFIDQAGQCLREALSTLTTEPAAPEARQEAGRIGDAVLDWMVKFDLLDAGNEYYASDVLAVLNDLAPTARPSEQAVTEAQPDPIELVREKIESLSKGKGAAEYVIATMVTNLKAGNVTTSQLLEWFESEGRAALKAAMEAGG